jgi:serine/threonine protein kinase
MIGKLHVLVGPDEGQDFSLEEGHSLTLGRGPNNDIKLTDPKASRQHAKLEMYGSRVYLEDSGSTSGCFVNDKKIERVELVPNDLITIGDTQLRFVAGSSHYQPALEGSSRQATLDSEMDSLIGTTLSHYRIDKLIARGQSGVVFQAQDERDDKTVALKVLPNLAHNEQDMQRFIRTLKTMMPLRHPNLIPIYLAGKTGDNCWVAMEWIDGESLTEVIRRIGVAGMLDWRHALRTAIHIGRALQYAHDHNIIHRNVTPTNIMLRSSDKVALLGDLMLAKAIEGSLAQKVTRRGELLGNLAYMAPERTKGDDAEIDGRSDLYGLGATAYALLTGHPPFQAKTLAETIQKIRTEVPVRPKKSQMGIPDLFEGVVMKLLAKDPNERHQTAQEMLEDLERVARYQNVAV